MEFNHNPLSTQDEFGVIDLKKYAYLLWEKAWLILLVLILAGAAAYIVSIRTTPVFEANATVLIEVPSFNTTEVSAITAAERLTRTYSEIMTNTNVLSQTIDRLEMRLRPSELEKMITVQPQPNTQLIDIKVESTDPAAAAVIANTLVEIFTQEINQLQSRRYQTSLANLESQMVDVEAQMLSFNAQLANAANEAERDRLESKLVEYQGIYSGLLSSYENIRLSEAQSLISVIMIEPALLPEEPARPRVMLNTALAALVGALLSAGGVFAADALDDRLKTPDEITDQLGLPVLGVIDTYNPGNGNELIAAVHPRSPITEEYRTLRTNVNFASVDRQLKSLLITSAEPGEGKTSIATNLAIVFAQSGLNTFIVDADLRRPALHTRFDLSNHNGLTAFFYRMRTLKLEDCWQTPFKNLNVLTAGSLPPNPAEILGSRRMQDLLADLKEQAEMLIIDSPPVLAVTDAVLLAPLVDGVLVVVQPGKTRHKAARAMLEELQRANANILGVAIKFMGGKRGRRYARRYGYYARSKYDRYYHAGADDPAAAAPLESKDTSAP